MSTELNATAGLPFSKAVRLANGKDIWGALEECEARMQIRVNEDPGSKLKYDFTSHLRLEFDLNDILIKWDLSGAETRLLKSGYYDLIISDAGPSDDRAIRLLHGPFVLDSVTTSP